MVTGCQNWFGTRFKDYSDSFELTSAGCANHHYRELNSFLDILLLANLYLRSAQSVRREHVAS